jgi:integrase/recombinase XerD
MTKEVIEQYNYQHFIRTNKSYSTQNQWINAIKLYLKVNDLSNPGLNQIERPRKQRKLPNVLSLDEVHPYFITLPT